MSYKYPSGNNYSQPEGATEAIPYKPYSYSGYTRDERKEDAKLYNSYNQAGYTGYQSYILGMLGSMLFGMPALVKTESPVYPFLPPYTIPIPSLSGKLENNPPAAYDLQRPDDYENQLKPQDYLNGYGNGYYITRDSSPHRITEKMATTYPLEKYAWQYSPADFNADDEDKYATGIDWNNEVNKWVDQYISDPDVIRD